MNFKGKKERLSALNEMPSLAHVDHRNLLDKNGKHPFMSKLSKSELRKLNTAIKELELKYTDILKKIKHSGAGFPVDKLLRELVHEYTHRYASSGTTTQPLNFNYFESFCNVKLFKNTIAPYAIPTTEIDHLFNLTDYFDYYTSSKIKHTDLTSLMELPESTTLHFTTNGDILDFSILNKEGREFVISGFSMVRRNNSLHWYLLGGEILTDDEWTLKSNDQLKIDMDNFNPSKIAFLKEAIDRDNYLIGSPVALEGTTTAIRTIITGEIDLTTKEYLGRCLMTEFENSFSLICDDPEIFIHDDDSKRKDMINIMKQKINHASPMWDLANSMFQLPSYFAYKVNITKEVVVAAGQKVKKLKSNGGRGIHAQYKTVSSIDILDKDIPIVRQVIPTHYKTNINGHWRRLPSGSIGKGINGEAESGRTWIKAKNEWRAPSIGSRVIYIKSTLKAAEIKVLEYQKLAESVPNEKTKKNSSNGELYVLRCTIMNEELYKVGWTSGTSIDRAKQLSSATGVPISFIVVNSWEHKDAEALEKSVHAMLEPYRLNDRREFFQASYISIKNIIEIEIQRSKK